jgi:hypothetical protein
MIGPCYNGLLVMQCTGLTVFSFPSCVWVLLKDGARSPHIHAVSEKLGVLGFEIIEHETYHVLSHNCL